MTEGFQENYLKNLILYSNKIWENSKLYCIMQLYLLTKNIKNFKDLIVWAYKTESLFLLIRNEAIFSI